MADIRKIRLNNTNYDLRDSRLDHNKIVFVGDSYGVGGSQSGNTYTPYPTRFASYTGATVYNLSESGAGFCNVGDSGHKFADLLATLSNTVDKTTITDVFFIGGYNDRVYSMSDIDTALASAISAAKSLYTKANIHVGFVGWGIGAGDYPILNRARLAYSYCTKYNVPYMNNLDMVMHNFEYFDTDGIHPNGNGQIAIAEAVINYIFTGYCTVKYPRAAVSITARNSAAFSGPLYQELSNDVLQWGSYDQFVIGGLTAFGSKTWNGDTTNAMLYVGDLVANAGYGRGYYGMVANLACIIHLTNGVSYQAMITIRFVAGQMYIIPYIIDASTGMNATGTIEYIVIPPFKLTCNASSN